MTRRAGLLFVVLCAVPACVNDIGTVDSKHGPPSSEPAEQQSPSSELAEQQSSDVEAAACIRDGACQPTGAHCCSANHLFSPFDCAGSSGYVCGTCIPSFSCQPTGDHCCSATHFFNPGLCGSTINGKQYSGYQCL
jgi:hypothetical protein